MTADSTPGSDANVSLGSVRADLAEDLSITTALLDGYQRGLDAGGYENVMGATLGATIASVAKLERRVIELEAQLPRS
jgi:hypothetical protein